MNNMEQRNKTHRTTEFSDYWYLREGDLKIPQKSVSG